MSVVIVAGDAASASAIAALLEADGVIVTPIAPGGLQEAAACEAVVLGLCSAAAGGELCRRLRLAAYRGTIIAVAAHRVAGVALLDGGADDFVLSPFCAREFVARVRAALRREAMRWCSRWGELEIDHRRRVGTLGGEVLPLTPREYAILTALVEARGTAVSRAALLRRVWSSEGDPGSNLVEAHVSRLRDKLGRGGHLISTVRGLGYRLAR